MSDGDDIKQRAVRAAKAVTLGAALFGTTACSSAEPEGGDTGWTLKPDAEATDTADDTSTRPDTVADTEQDTAPTCSGMNDGVCPQACTSSNDADCCEQTGGSWFDGGSGGGCAVPGPFVPPAMPAAMT